MNDLYVDVGSTNIKWQIKDNISFKAFPNALRDDYPFFEVSAEEIVNIIKSVIEKEEPDRVFFSVQMHGYVLLKDGKRITEYVSWRDERGKEVKPDFTLSSENGVNIKPNLPRLSVMTVKEKFDEFCTLGSYIVRCLTGVNATHITDCAASGFYNVKNRTQENTPYKLPSARYSVEKVGEYFGSEIYTPVGDQQSAIKGVISFMGEDDCYILNMGTATQLCLLEDGFVSGDFESRPFFGGKTLCTVTGLLGGRYIATKSDEELVNELYENYLSAMKRLPKKDVLVATGGVVKHREQLIERVVEKFGINCILNDECDALFGLKNISREI